jgi:hypothetical protein
MGTVHAQTKPAAKPVAKSVAKPSPPQAPALKGVGIFRIGESADTVLAVVLKNLNRSLVTYSSSTDILTHTNDMDVIDVKMDSVDTYQNEFAMYSPNARVLYLRSYPVADIEIQNLYLTFYNNKLCRIEADYSSELEQAFTDKYGKGEASVTQKPISCSYRLTGQKFTEKEITAVKRWYNKNVVATSYLSSYYDSKCKQQFVSFFKLIDRAESAKLEQSEAVEKAKLKAVAERKRKQKLSEL